MKHVSGFDNIFTAFNCLYDLLTFDNYPEVMFPALEKSYLYLLYFLPFVTLCYLVFIPVPVGVTFEAYRVIN